MAKVNDNLVTEGLSGKLGKRLVFRRGKGGATILSTRPTFSEDRVFNPTQVAQQSAFKEAIAYARDAKDQPIYINKSNGTAKTSYNVAVADWFGVPEVLEIDTTEWTGAAGQTIRIKAQDDTHVAGVLVNIHGADDSLIEQGQAVKSDGLWWAYTTTVTTTQTPEVRVTAVARDLPGNSNGMVWQNN